MRGNAQHLGLSRASFESSQCLRNNWQGKLNHGFCIYGNVDVNWTSRTRTTSSKPVENH
ncbi:hypothetical protein X777_00665 [Ooceraea biroi]|uniref:Uncharacterized protein n=1 Tax=Ooceraea biroi TaxID=2015173 RepID=A0A026X2Q4_OOCBI|nr:hypothetical protein X777_00665 [Ooceraea biroi]